MTYIIDENKAREIIENTNGRFVTIDFIKMNGEPRRFNGRLGVKRYLKGGKTTYNVNPDNIGLFVNKEGYKCFNIKRLVAFRANGKRYTVAHSTNV